MDLPGFYGKLPAVGDFVQRRLPAEFVGPWDRWLQATLLAGQADAGADWLDRYRAAPGWAFLLAPGCIDARAWIGLMLPSVDRVGRHFPLTVAQSCPLPADAAGALARCGGWLRALERLVHEALDGAMDLAAFDARLAQLGPAPLAHEPAAEGDETMPLAPRRAPAPFACRIASAADYDRFGRDVSALRRPAALFAGGVPLMVLAHELLPDPALGVALFDGDWTRHGWRAALDDDDTVAVADANDQTLPLTRPHP